MNPHEILEITPGASSEEIKAAYYRLAKKWHPDRFSGAEKVEAEQRFRLLAEAFNMLKDSGRREEAAQVPVRTSPAPSTPPVPVVQLNLDQAAKPVPPQQRTASDWYEEAKAAYDSKDYDRGMGLIHYCIRMDAEKADYQVLLAKLLDASGGDKKALVRALESAIRLNPKDVDSTIRLAEVFQSVGMYARATKLWESARQIAPNHKIFLKEQKKNQPTPKGSPGTLGEQLSDLKEQGKALVNRWFKRG